MLPLEMKSPLLLKGGTVVQGCWRQLSGLEFQLRSSLAEELCVGFPDAEWEH